MPPHSLTSSPKSNLKIHKICSQLGSSTPSNTPKSIRSIRHWKNTWRLTFTHCYYQHKVFFLVFLIVHRAAHLESVTLRSLLYKGSVGSVFWAHNVCVTLRLAVSYCHFAYALFLFFLGHPCRMLTLHFCMYLSVIIIWKSFYDYEHNQLPFGWKRSSTWLQKWFMRSKSCT